jgi:uncharacterized membrane-anchored protein YjiN (DUF445 family)
MGRRAKNELANLARTARAHLSRAEALGRSLDERLKVKKEASEMWTPDEDWRRDFGSVTQTIQHAGNSLVRALEGNKKNLGGLTVEQLEAQFNAEIVQAAPSLTDEQWQRMVDARAKARR